MKYFEQAIRELQSVAESQAENIDSASNALVQAIGEGRTVYSFGASHSFILTEELVYRTGGLMLVNPIYPHGMNLFVRPMTMTSKLERVEGLGYELLGSVPLVAGDVVLVTSTSGRNAVALEVAMGAKKAGAKVIGITSVAYTEGVASRHSSGKKLVEVCDIVIDNGAPYGDAAVEIDGFPQKVGPLSTVTGCAIVNELVAQTVEKLVQRGIEPPVFMSANLDGGEEANERLLGLYRDRIHYLD